MPQSRGAQRIEDMFRVMCLPRPTREFQFAPPNGWKFDWCWLTQNPRIALEYEGHQSHRGSRYESDCLKYSEASIRGYTLLRFTDRMLDDGTAVSILRRAFRAEELPPRTFGAEAPKGKPIMPAVSTFEREVIAKGVYLFTLTEIEVRASTLKRDDGSAGGDFWIWKWRGKHVKTQDKAKLETSSGTSVSKKDSALKSLLSSAYPDMTLEDMKTFNTDEMIGKSWQVSVGVVMDDKGEKKNKIIDIEASEKDPFADSDDD